MLLAQNWRGLRGTPTLENPILEGGDLLGPLQDASDSAAGPPRPAPTRWALSRHLLLATTQACGEDCTAAKPPTTPPSFLRPRAPSMPAGRLPHPPAPPTAPGSQHPSGLSVGVPRAWLPLARPRPREFPRWPEPSVSPAPYPTLPPTPPTRRPRTCFPLWLNPPAARGDQAQGAGPWALARHSGT